MRLRLNGIAYGILLAYSLPYANAQTTTAPEQSLEAINVFGEQIGSFKSNSVQVGTFRDLNPLDVPQTSNIVTREVLDAQAANTLFGALRNTAGVTRSQLNGSTYDNIAIRGILVENRGNYRLNGSLPVINLVDIPLENKERVEVLKGSSSLYYGFIPPSGIVNMVTKRAGNEPVSSITFTGNEHGAAGVHADIGRRFGDQQQFGARFNVAGGREDIGVDNYSGDRSLVAGAFDFRATRDLSFKLDVEHYRKDVSEQAAIVVPTAVGGVIALPNVPDNKTNLAGKWQKYDAKATNILFRTDYSINENWTALFEAGKAKTERDRNFSQFRLANPATGAGTLDITFNRGQEWVNENYRAELTGRTSGEWISNEITFGFMANDRDANSIANGSATGIAQNLYNPVDIAERSPTGAAVSTISSIKDRGWYLSDRISFGEQWQVMAGVRSSRFKSTSPTENYRADEVSPSAAVMYKPVSNVSVYASYIEGVEQTGQAGTNRANAGELLPPAVAKQKELGVKAEVAQGVLVQAAYFDIERPSTAIDAANRFVLNGLAEYKGFEFAASGEVNKQLSLIGSLLFMDAEQLNRASATTYGRTPENTPKRTASLFAEYKLQSVPGLALSGGIYYIGERPVDNENRAFIGGYSTYSLGARYITKFAGKRTTLQAVLDNVTDKDYWSTAGNGLLGVGTPRTLKVVAKIDF